MDLWIQILGPGHILIMYSGRTIAALIANRAVFIDSRSFLHSIIPKIAAQAQKTVFTREAEGTGILTVQQAEMALLHEGLGGSLWNLSLFSEMGWLEKGVSKNEKGNLAGVVRWMRSSLLKQG